MRRRAVLLASQTFCVLECIKPTINRSTLVHGYRRERRKDMKIIGVLLLHGCGDFCAKEGYSHALCWTQLVADCLGMQELNNSRVVKLLYFYEYIWATFLWLARHNTLQGITAAFHLASAWVRLRVWSMFLCKTPSDKTLWTPLKVFFKH